MTDLTLTVQERRLVGWTEATVVRSLEHIAGTFRLQLSERAPGEAVPRLIAPGDACELELDGETVIKGYVDSVRVRYDGGSHEIEVRGRDATGDLVDCSAAIEPGEWAEQKLERIAAALAEPFGVPVSTNADTGQAFRKFKVEPGESVFEAIERGCRLRGVLALPDGRGGVVLGRPSRSRAGVRLTRDDNILAATAELDWLDRYSDYEVLGQQQGADWISSAEEAAHVGASATDAGVSRDRRLIVIAEQGLDQAAAQSRADWEASVRAARSRHATITVQGWRETEGGALWSPGRLVHVADDWLGLDRELLVVAVEQAISEAGTTARLLLSPEQAFEPRIVPEKRAAARIWI